MKSQKQKPAVPWPLIVLFFILAAAAVVVGLLFYESQKKQNLDISTKELSAIADLKVKQIIQWRSERISDGSNFSENVTLMKQFAGFLDQPGNKSLRDELFEDLKALTENYDYRNVIFVDRDCNVILYYPDQDTVIGTYLEALLNRIMLKGEIVVTDLLRDEEVSFPHLDMLVPLKRIGVNDTTVFGALVLRIDPEKILYPLIQSWPSTTKTSEAILFHREGDSIVYLNELRHLQDSYKVLRRSITDEKLVDAKALQGIMETTDAIDYRGVPVIAAMKKVPESSWFLVAKVDRKEVYSSIQPNLRLIVIIIILFIFAIGSLLGFFWWNQRVRFYRQKYETELDRLALVRHFDYILKYANDIILLIDKDFNIIEANDKALETYMYNREEFIGQPFNILHSYISMKEFVNDFKPLDEIGYATFEAYHKKKDGSIFPIEISARRVDIEGVKYYQSISRDITERKIAEETLKESEEKFRNIFEESPLSIAVTGKDMVILRANSAYCRMLGYSEEELLGMTYKDFTHPDHIQADELAILKLVSREINIYHTEKRYLKNDGSIIWGSATISIIRNKDDEIHFFLEMVEDITSKIIAAAQLEKSFSLQKATLESTEDGILVVDTNRKIVQFNRKFADMWRIPEDIIQSGEDATVIKYVQNQLKDPGKFISKIDKLYSDPEAITSDLIEFVDGRFFERYSQPQKLSNVTVGRVWSFRNITDRKKAEAEIIAAKEKAEESDRLKTAFLH
ncbi:MAG: PAS domain S-box protein, partial [Bacteroidales bacterium]|nr:PAS domain S-box protein [Bacteroidales bacterium]